MFVISIKFTVSEALHKLNKQPTIVVFALKLFYTQHKGEKQCIQGHFHVRCQKVFAAPSVLTL